MENGIEYFNKMQPIASNVSFFIPSPVLIYVMPNTFVQFKRQSSASEEVGIIISINAEAHNLQVRLFLSWQQMMQRISPDRIGNVSFWCRQNAKHPPFYLCDSDIVVEIAASDIIGLAFVFHESDSILRQLDGLANTYVVTSIYLSQSLKVEHAKTFFSFPCQVNEALPTCCSSMIFEQITKIKNKIQLAMNTRSLKSKNVQSVQLENVHRLTWHYITRDSPNYRVEIVSSYGTVKVTFMENDSCVVQKWRELQETFLLSTAQHFRFAKLLLGTCVGVGVRCIIRCSLKNAGRLERMESCHQISVGDTINAIKFDGNDTIHVMRGITFRYMPSTSNLSVTIRFSRYNDARDVRAILKARNISTAQVDDDDMASMDNDDASDATDEGNVWPFHSNTEIEGSKIKDIDIRNQVVTMENNIRHTFNEAIDKINSSIQ
jgi:hypothetical protein